MSKWKDKKARDTWGRHRAEARAALDRARRTPSPPVTASDRSKQDIAEWNVRYREQVASTFQRIAMGEELSGQGVQVVSLPITRTQALRLADEALSMTRYWEAIGQGFSEYEAAEEGWPEGGR